MFAGTPSEEDGNSEFAVSAHHSLPFTDQFDLQLKINALFLLHSFPHQLDQSQNIFSLCIRMINKEISVHRADLSITDPEALQTRGFDQPTRIISIRILEH